MAPENKNVALALELTLNLIRDIQTQGITEEEFNLAKKSLMNSAAFMLDTPQKRLMNTFTEILFGLKQGFFSQYSTYLEPITHAQVNTALKNFLKPDQLVITILGTASSLKPILQSSKMLSAYPLEVIPLK
jgi:zinc protease